MRVGVVGAGIGGLAVAAGLQRAGAEVTVFERAQPRSDEGSGLSLFGNGLAALDALGLRAARRDRGIVSSGESGGVIASGAAGQRAPDGRLLSRLPSSVAATVVVVHRSELRHLLLSAVAPGTVTTGDAVTGVDAAGRTVMVSGRSQEFDVVVAADGIRSRLRAGWPGDPGMRYSGYRAWRGVTAEPVDVGGVVGETVGRGMRFGIAPIDGGTRSGCVYWFAAISGPAVREPSSDDLGRFAGWHDPIPALLAATPPPDRQGLPIEELAGRVSSFRRGRCVLLGDAAHAMTPNLGQGGNQALEDAATLGVLLSGLGRVDGRGIDAALTAYDRLRRPRTQRVARQAALLGQVLQAAGPVSSRLRDAALRLAPERVVARQLLAVQRWSPPGPAPGL
ncbi:hypothetical protein FDO65_07260 [Nakamurella flava]|uniref:FAD-binding domain-containing protein n=1 Tax=Nakamurella flava TaxID=2576308 RepID=A0A4V6CU32_9ACTN|nr:hypothetical protein FDO65_07260 [Nakamurella flava]